MKVSTNTKHTPFSEGKERKRKVFGGKERIVDRARRINVSRE